MNTARMLLLAVTAAVVGFFALPSNFGHATTYFTVTKTSDTNDGACNEDCSLREAIIAANASPGYDIITVPAGTYLLTIGGTGEDAAAMGDLDITTGDLTINGAGAATTIIDGGDLDRVLQVLGPVNVAISGVTVRNGSVPGSGGGGIYNAGDLTLTNTNVSDNEANWGGGIWNAAGPAGRLTLTNSTVSGNTASPGSGGGIDNNSTLALTSSTVSNNSSALYGGGIFNNGGVATLNTSTVSNNSAFWYGGGISNDGGVATIDSSTVSGNEAPTGVGRGGGIYNNSGDLKLSNSTVSNNFTGGTGGGTYNDGTATFSNVTVSSNSAGSGGGGIYYVGGLTATFKNTIVANSPIGGGCGGAPVGSEGFNLSSDATCAFIWTGDMQNTDPKLGPLAFNGGTTPTHALLDGSPAADAGAISCPPPATDQQGVSRPQGFRCDIGAYEAPDSDGDGVADPRDSDDDNDSVPDSSEWPGCRALAEDYDGFQDGDGCPDPDNDLDGVCDAGQTSVSCTGSDSGQSAFYPPGHSHGASTIDCRNIPEDYDAFYDSDGCPEPDNDNDGLPDVTDSCPGSDSHLGPDLALGVGADQNHNGKQDGAEVWPAPGSPGNDDSVQTFEDYDGILDTDGCHDSPGDDFDGDSFGIKSAGLPVFHDDREAFLGTDPGRPCAATPTADDEPAPDAWAADFNDDQTVDIRDAAAFRGVFRNPAAYSPRFDYNADGTVDIQDVGFLRFFFRTICLR